MSKRLCASVVAFVLAAGIATPVLASSCSTPAEARAAKVRQLQTELMVAALKCNGHPTLDIPAKYNSFVSSNNSHLSKNADVLRGYFTRTYGKGSGKRFDSFITSMANDASMRSLNVSGYCESMDPILTGALETHDLEGYAASQAFGGESLNACGGASEKVAGASHPAGKASPKKKEVAHTASAKAAPAKAASAKQP